MPHSSRKTILKETSRLAALAGKSQDYALARDLWQQVHLMVARVDNRAWAFARMQFCERVLARQRAVTGDNAVTACG
ncbi:TPA: ANR family transcriptional regulator [Klebsiella oxytoca]|uniref:ANR family transcriptional regulator n=1 Tax=Klebsiella oxytoca TaxID=571 RepID=A0AAN5RDH2_KLEOX|nr:ANR family transcriptional regulator [Klebsiella oxytoca]